MIYPLQVLFTWLTAHEKLISHFRSESFFSGSLYGRTVLHVALRAFLSFLGGNLPQRVLLHFEIYWNNDIESIDEFTIRT
jgi:hypothetical protein